MKKSSLFILSMLLATAGFSQSIKNYVITSAGAALMDVNGGIYISIGEPMNTEIDGGEIMISQGFLNVTIAGSTVAAEDLLTEIIKVYPNPTVEQLNIVLPEMSGDYQYQLTDLSGKLISNSSITERTTPVDFTQMKAGTYFIKVVKEEKYSKTLKIIKI